MQYYQSLINLRKNYKCLRRGDYQTILIDDEKYLFAFKRSDSEGEIRVIFNLSDNMQNYNEESVLPKRETWRFIFGEMADTGQIKPKSARVFLKVQD